ncbi:hypothetical protein LOC71_14075 [Rhodopirellula sp. JC740]|uniref:STAS domain-containing protein n=1 Tax=Rhodopirellula halodulae TaxID=2894198 RepID=A0ABS8NKR8_9BACT|nr:hypothetical protein [Rhodopirellula sp. JC740]MCC9643408.1 hypothetical protein [Rhodopirellula sp. JC740]
MNQRSNPPVHESTRTQATSIQSTSIQSTPTQANSQPRQTPMIVLKWDEQINGQLPRGSLEQLKERLRRGIDHAEGKVILDLRSVSGVPSKLLLFLDHVVAYAKGRRVDIAFRATDPDMRRMLQRWSGPSAIQEPAEVLSIYDLHSSTIDAATNVIRSSLEKRSETKLADPRPKTAASVSKADPAKKRRRRTRKDFAVFAGVILAGTTVVATVEYWIIFHESAPTLASPIKTFEGDKDEMLKERDNKIRQLERALAKAQRERDDWKKAANESR